MHIASLYTFFPTKKQEKELFKQMNCYVTFYENGNNEHTIRDTEDLLIEFPW